MAIPLPPRPPLVTVPVSRALWRLRQVEHPVPERGVVDDPALGYGVLYLAETPGVAVLETLVRGARRCVVARTEWESRSVARVSLSEKLRVLQFEGKRLPEFGIGADRAHAGIYDECQELSAAVHASLPDVDGIQFRSRWDQSRLCWAVFDRAAHKIAGAERSIPLQDSPVGDEVLDTYPIRIV
jgi:hypothetical protein